jgi:hypothetical protein
MQGTKSSRTEYTTQHMLNVGLVKLELPLVLHNLGSSGGRNHNSAYYHVAGESLDYWSVGSHETPYQRPSVSILAVGVVMLGDRISHQLLPRLNNAMSATHLKYKIYTRGFARS